MRFTRIGDRGEERPAVVVNDEEFVDISDTVVDIDASFWEGNVIARVQQMLLTGRHEFPLRQLGEARIGAPIARPHQIVCVGLNYVDHIVESQMQRPDEPVVFNKSPNSICGPTDDIITPRGARKLDYEVELGVVIGRRCQYLDGPVDALESIGGYLVVNDVSERSFQLERGGQWVKGKSAESFNPCGPYLVTPDEVKKLGTLELSLDVNGVRRQTGKTNDMLFGVAEIIHYLSQFMTLEPGDLINTGTPPGVALGMNPPLYLQPGDVVECAITGLGRQRSIVSLTSA